MSDTLDRLKTALADRYAIERELGAGGMATVYLAEDLKHHRKVAVKVLRPELAAAIGAERFLREIEVAAQLNHPHILALYDSGEADGYLYYVMPVVEGESLRDRLDHEHQLPIDDAIRLTEQIASALDYAHRQGVLHRDIKPENVLLHEGEAMVTDFGIALAMSEAGSTRLTETGFSLGTPHYMSPEQAAGAQDLDARSDVYALGCVLFEMLAGEPPFTGNTAQSVIAKRIAESAPNVSTLRDTVPASVNESLAKALARSPADRYESAAAFASALAATRTITTGETTAPHRWNHPVAAAALFGIASLVILGVVYLAMLQLGLPDWVLRAAVGLLVVGLPIFVTTAFAEQQRIVRPDRAGQRWLTWRRAVQGGGLAFAGLAVVTTGFMALRGLGIGPVGTLMAKGVLEARDPILLADFANRTSDTTLATTITELLRIDLSQSRVVRLLDPATVIAARQRMVVAPDAPLDEALARQVAEREGVNAVLTGEVAAVGRGYVLSARLISPANGALLSAVRATAEDDTELIAAIDQLSARLRERIGESLRDIRASPALERVTTTSLPALRKYTQAMSPAGLADGPLAGVRLLEQAVALDTTFAMAYRRLGVILGQTGRPDAGRTALRRAFELRDRLPEIEAHLVAGMYYSNVAYDAAGIETAYRSALALDPDNVFALINLAAHVSASRQWAVRESLALRSVEVQPMFVGYLNVFSAQLLQRKFGDAETTMNRFAQGRGEPANWRFRLETARRDYDRAEEAIPGQIPGTDFRFIDLMRLRGRFGEAERALRNPRPSGAAVSGPSFEAMYRLASVQADLGSLAAGIRLIDSYQVDSLPLLERRYLERAEFYAGAGRVDRARALVADFEAQADAGLRLRHPATRSRLLRVSGEIALSEGRFGDAVADFTRVNELSGQCTTCGLARLAFAWFQSGRADSALSVYERVVSTPTSGLDEDDVRWLSHTYRQLGELYEARNDTANAINYYNEFVELWKDADPELQPQVEDVRRRIANLIGEPSGR
ncbi:MAG: protein kinase [Gemmatimonadetes bacterium]|nr:protein kinase [Gemmatimonadota bacterium]